MAYTLINARPSPYGRKVAIALVEKGLEYDVRYDVPWGPDTCTPLFSPLEQLPILLTPVGPIYDSSYILEWLEIIHPRPGLIPKTPEARLDCKLRQMLGERLMEAAQMLVFELHRPEPSVAWIERQTRKVQGTLRELDARAAARTASTSDLPDLGDLAVATTLLVLEFIVPAGLSPEVDAFLWRNRYPRIASWVGRLEERASFQRTKPELMDVDLQSVVAS